MPGPWTALRSQVAEDQEASLWSPRLQLELLEQTKRIGAVKK